MARRSAERRGNRRNGNRLLATTKIHRPSRPISTNEVVHTTIGVNQRAPMSKSPFPERRDRGPNPAGVVALLDSETWLRIAFENIPDVILTADRSGTIRFINSAPRRGTVEVVGTSAFEYLGGPDRDRVREAFDEVVSTSSPRTLEIRSEGDALRLVRMIPLRPSDPADGVLVIATDITERERAEKASRLAKGQPPDTRNLESLGVLAGGLAHDFNNLLTGILGSANLAASKLSPGSPVAEQLDRILTAAERASELTRKMLAYAGKGRFDKRPTDLNDVVETAVARLRATIETRGYLRLALAPNLPAIQADPDRLHQVVVNLLTNAVEALVDEDSFAKRKPGIEPEIHVRTGAVARRPGDGDEASASVFLEVRDEGVGMDEETRKRIFEPFFSTKPTGRGLGLAVVQGIVGVHRGAIQVESAPQRGSAFTVLFPARSPSPGQGAKIGDARERARATGTILVVDDEPTVREVARLSLEARGFTVLTAEDGPSGIALFEKRRDDVDAVLLDLTMPGLSGAETLAVLTEMKPGLPVVLTSGHGEQEVWERFRGRRLAGFVQKPFRPRDLVSRIVQALEKPFP